MEKKWCFNRRKGQSCFLRKALLIMKLTVLLTLITIGQLWAVPGYSQTVLLNFDLKNATIEEVINKIEETTNYYFLYNKKLVDVERRVDIHVENKSLTQVLNQLFGGSNVGYTVVDRQIVLSEKGNLQQSVKITGKVTDNSGAPLPGVTVVVKGTGKGVITDTDGKYYLEDVASNAVLVFSFVGMKQQEVPADRSVIDIKLQEETIGLEEVVAVGYGVQKKVNLTGSVASIEATQLADKPVATTSQAIAGLVPGLSVVQSSGRPGTSATVKIRGTGTFSKAGTDPLVLIDGMAGNLDDVDPDNIESISFLKDAASAAIYGNRAANGVILIQTKKGKEGKISITYNSSFGWQKPSELPDFLPSWEYATYYNEAMSNMGNSAAYTDEQIQKYKDGSDPDNYPNVNHLKWLLNSGSGFQQRHTVSLQGGTAALTYNFSAGYWEQNGMTEKTSNKRYSVLWNMKSQFAKSLTLNTHINAYTDKYNAPNGEPQSIDGIIGYAVREGPVYAGKKSDGTFGYQDNYSPEAWLASSSFAKKDSVNITGSVQLVWDTPVKGLTLSGKAGITYDTGYNKTFRAETVFDETKTVGPASLAVTSDNSTYKTFEAIATYKRTFNSHSINLIAGSSRETYHYNHLYGSRNTFPNNSLYELASGSASSSTNDGSAKEWALVSFFGRANYSFKERYLFEANLRYDGSSRFSKANRWGVFPSFSGGWRISEEDFWKGLNISNVVNNFKIRASWGELGNQNIGTYPYQQTYTLGENAVLGNTATLVDGAKITTYNDEDISWETTSVTDIGLDFSLVGGRIDASIDYFYKYTDKILSSVEVTKIMGMSVGQSNVGAVSNKGIEFNLTYHGKIGKEFNFTVTPNFTYIKNAVEELADGAQEDLNNNRIVGKPLGIIYGYRTNGLFVDQDEIDAAPTQLVSSVKPGYVRYADISGPDGVPDGEVDSDYDRSVIGSTTPKYYYGLNLSASCKGFDFSALLQGLGGYQRLIGSYMAYAFYNGGQIQRWQADNRWTTDNPDKWAKYPRLETLNSSNANLQTSNYWVRNASFLRIKNVQIGYTFPKNIVTRFGLQKLRVYFSGQNLYNFTSFYKGWDPENEIGTGDSPSFYPINSIYSFGFNVVL